MKRKEKKAESHKPKKKSFWKRIRFKYKLSFINESTLDEVWSFRVSQLRFFSAVCLFALVLIVITSLIIITTPIRNYLPGYLDAEVRREIVQSAIKADSLDAVLKLQRRYMMNVTAIITGTMKPDSIHAIDSSAYISADYNIPRSKDEADFVKKYEEEEKYNLSAGGPGAPRLTENAFFYKPVNGVISSHYNIEKRHYGVDLVAGFKESVVATLEGTVIYTGNDPAFGNVITLQHKNGFTSVYKHNEALLKDVGDHVVAGEAIALVGNTGTLSTGPHLHFELWYRGTSVNPEEYIAF